MNAPNLIALLREPTSAELANAPETQKLMLALLDLPERAAANVSGEVKQLHAGITALFQALNECGLHAARLEAQLASERWIPVDVRLPDDDITVRIATTATDEPVWLGFHDENGWHSVDAAPLGGMVTHWKTMEKGPNG